MPSSRPIIVATDLSARDDRAIDRALLLGERWRCPVGVVHVLDRAVEPAAQEDWRDKVRAVLPDPLEPVDIFLPTGAPPRAIADAARDYGAGLIVTGIARMNRWCEFFLGNAVDHLLRHADAPLLIVKQRPHTPYDRIMVATDHSQGSTAALLTAASMFRDTPIDLVHAYHVPYEELLGSDSVRKDIAAEEMEAMAKFLAQDAIDDALRGRISPHIVEGDTGAALAKAIEDLRPDLFVVGTYGHGGFHRATIGSKAESLTKWVPVDTLAVRG